MPNLLLPIFKLLPSRGLRYMPIRPIGTALVTMRPRKFASLQTQRAFYQVKSVRDTNQMSS